MTGTFVAQEASPRWCGEVKVVYDAAMLGCQELRSKVSVGERPIRCSIDLTLRGGRQRRGVSLGDFKILPPQDVRRMQQVTIFIRPAMGDRWTVRINLDARRTRGGLRVEVTGS